MSQYFFKNLNFSNYRLNDIFCLSNVQSKKITDVKQYDQHVKSILKTKVDRPVTQFKVLKLSAMLPVKDKLHKI